MPSTTTRRRAKGSGYKGADGRWHCRGALPNGASRVFHGATQAEAIRRRDKAMGAFVATADGTVAAAIAEWLEGRRLVLGPQTWRRYDQLLRLHVVPFIGDLALAAVTAKDYTNLQARLAREATLSGTTRRHLHVVLGTFMRAMLEDGRIATSPVRKSAAPKADSVERQPLSVDEARRLIEASRSDEYHSFFVLMLTTGLRPGEAMALHWSDVDLTRGEVAVRGNVIRDTDGAFVIAKPKTAKSYRTVTLSPTAVTALTARRERQPRSERDLVFPGRDGRPTAATSISRDHFRPIAKLAGLPDDVTLAHLRPTFASNGLKDNVPITTISRMLGHSSTVVTFNHYAKYVPGDDVVGAASAERLYG